VPGEAAPAPAHRKLVNTGEVWLDAALVTLMSPTVTIDPTAVDFGTIQAGIPGRLQRTIAVSNQGPGELVIGSIDYFEDRSPARPASIIWGGGTCGFRISLPPGGSCTVLLEFGSLDPVSSTGELRFYDNALDSPQGVHLSGTATPPPPSVPGQPPRPAPLVTLSGHPVKRMKSRIATFAFSANQDTTLLQCRIDQKAFRPCTSPARYRSLKPGKHRFWVRPIGTFASIFPPAVLGPTVSYGWRVIAPPAKNSRH